MDRGLAIEKVQAVIAKQLCLHPDRYTLDARLSDLRADSLDVVQVCVTLEDTLNIEIPSKSIGDMSTVKDLIDYIEQHA